MLLDSLTNTSSFSSIINYLFVSGRILSPGPRLRLSQCLDSVSSSYLFEAICYYNLIHFSCMLVHDGHSVGCCVPPVGPLWLGAGECGGVVVLPWGCPCIGLSSCAIVICCLCGLMWSISQASKHKF